jgi:4'-phosphopantetheinyl transferase
MLEILPSQVDLWLAFPDEIQNKQLLDRYRQLLTEQERCQERRFHFIKDQHSYLVTRALVRTVLSRYAPVAPGSWSFSMNAYGKPEIQNDDGGARGISFSISHTQGLIVLGITNEKLLGVDTENVRERPGSIEVARHFFSPDEIAALYASPPATQHDRFFQYWTLKEAYIKARGMGMSIPFEQFSINLLNDAHASISFHSLLHDHPSRWRFWQFRVLSDYLMAICVERAEGATQQLTMRKVVPLAEEETFSCVLLREPLAELPCDGHRAAH